MHGVAAPYGVARDDYAIFAELAERLGVGQTLTLGIDGKAGSLIERAEGVPCPTSS